METYYQLGKEFKLLRRISDMENVFHILNTIGSDINVAGKGLRLNECSEDIRYRPIVNCLDTIT